jgi:DNA-binding NarL/FixJ family response regulator
MYTAHAVKPTDYVPRWLLSSLDDAAAKLMLYGVSLEIGLPNGQHQRVHASPRPSAAPCPSELLSAQEWRIARLVAYGSTNAEIAASLSVSPKTVESHLTRTFRRLGVRSRTELTRQVLMAERAIVRDDRSPLPALHGEPPVLVDG